MTGLYYGEFEIGDTIEHARRRTVSESDNQRFCDMTMNQQPLHLDAAFAEETQFGDRLVNGLYTTSLAVGLSIPDTTDGTIVANLSYDNVEHPNPVFHGDTIRARSTVTEKRETSDGERGVVTMHVEAFTVADMDGEENEDMTDEDGDVTDEDGDVTDEDGDVTDEDGDVTDEDGDVTEGNEGVTDEDGDAEGDTLVCSFDRTFLSLKRPDGAEH